MFSWHIVIFWHKQLEELDLTKCGRCIREAKWQIPDTSKVYCWKHVPKHKTVIPISVDILQTRLSLA